MSTIGVVYGIGEDVDEVPVGLRQRIKQEAHADGRPIYTPLVGLSLMVFFAIACQCMSTLAVVKRETPSWTWPTFLFIYTGALACCLVYLDSLDTHSLLLRGSIARLTCSLSTLRSVPLPARLARLTSGWLPAVAG